MGIQDIKNLSVKRKAASTPEIPNSNNDTSVMSSDVEKDNNEPQQDTAKTAETRLAEEIAEEIKKFFNTLIATDGLSGKSSTNNALNETKELERSFPLKHNALIEEMKTLYAELYRKKIAPTESNAKKIQEAGLFKESVRYYKLRFKTIKEDIIKNHVARSKKSIASMGSLHLPEPPLSKQTEESKTSPKSQRILLDIKQYIKDYLNGKGLMLFFSTQQESMLSAAKNSNKNLATNKLTASPNESNNSSKPSGVSSKGDDGPQLNVNQNIPNTTKKPSSLPQEELKTLAKKVESFLNTLMGRDGLKKPSMTDFLQRRKSLQNDDDLTHGLEHAYIPQKLNRLMSKQDDLSGKMTQLYLNINKTSEENNLQEKVEHYKVTFEQLTEKIMQNNTDIAEERKKISEERNLAKADADINTPPNATRIPSLQDLSIGKRLPPITSGKVDKEESELIKSIKIRDKRLEYYKNWGDKDAAQSSEAVNGGGFDKKMNHGYGG